MSSLTHYELRVIRLEGLRCKSKAPNLFVEVKLGEDVVCKTEIIKKNKSPKWDKTFTFSSSDASALLNVCVLKRSRFRKRNHRIYFVECTPAELLKECTCGEAKIDLSPSSNEGSSASVGTIFLQFKDMDAEERGKIVIEDARRDIERIKGSADKAESTGTNIANLVLKLDDIVKVVDQVKLIHPYLNLTWQITSALYRIVSHQFKTDQKLIDLVQLMEKTFEFARDAKSLTEKTRKIKGGFESVLKTTCECSRFVEEYTKHNFAKRTTKIGSSWKMDHFKEQFIALKKALDSEVALHTTFLVDRMAIKVDLMDLRHRLQIVDDQSQQDVSKRRRCEPKTRVQYLHQIMDGLFSDTDQNIVWLTGAAGSGKSTIAVTVSDNCDEKSCPAAYLFFGRKTNEHVSVIRAIAYKLAVLYPLSVAPLIAKALDEPKNRNITGNVLEDQFNKLLLEPLSALGVAVQGEIIIVLDALDESGSISDRRALLRLIKDGFPKLPPRFRFLITSRPENDILETLNSLQGRVLDIRLNHTSAESRKDVHIYIDSAMRETIETVPEDWDWDAGLQILSNAANGLFIWASTAVKMVSDRHDEPMEELKDLVQNVRSVDEFEFGLDKLYATVLEQSGIPWRNADAKDRFKNVMGPILFGKETFSDDIIDQFLDLKGKKSRLALERLRSVLSYEPGEPIRLHHASFADYLKTPERSKEWSVEANSQNRMIITRCFDVMGNLLHFNMGDLQTSFIFNKEVGGLDDRVNEKVPAHLKYACLFWGDHLSETSNTSDVSDLLDKLRTFANRCLLYWLEVLSLTRNVNRISSLSKANKWTAKNDPSLSSFFWDAYKKASMFAHPVSQCAPHIYLSLLSLIKESSRFNSYSKTHPIIRAQAFGTKARELCIKVLKGHADGVRSIAFSPDGKRIVSGSGDDTIRIWDAETGEGVLGPLEGHTDWVNSIAFSPDGKRIVSGSGDETIRIWDAESGESILGPLEGHADWVNSVAFSPDGKRIVSGSSDCTIRIWDAETGKGVLGPLEGHTAFVNSVAFSHDGKRIVSGSADRSIRVWDVQTGKGVLEPLQGHTDRVNSVAFSPDGKRIVSGSDDHTIRIWDAETGKGVLGLLEGHAGLVNSVAFSPDGKRIVSGSNDLSIRVWDVETGEGVSGPLEGHTSFVHSVAFSPDGKHVVSGSSDCTIRIWDAETGKGVLEPLQGHTDRVNSVAFSPDGKRIVSGSNDRSIRVWDAETGEGVLGPLEGQTKWVRSVAFSPDGKRIVSGSNDRSIRVWDAETGEGVLGPLEGHTSWVNSVAFSPDGKHVVSGSSDRTIRIWNAETGKGVLGLLEGHAGLVNSVAFSPDRRPIVSGSNDLSIRVWDVETGEGVSGPLEGHTSFVHSVAFSPDGERIVSGSNDRSIRVWDVQTGKGILEPLQGHTDRVNSVAFSPDGKRIVSGSDDYTLRIWDSESGEGVLGRLEGHTAFVNSVAFSPDGKHVVSGSSDCTIRIWDAETGKGVLGPMEGHTADVNSVAFSPDGERVVSGSEDCTIRVWDVGHGRVEEHFLGARESTTSGAVASRAVVHEFAESSQTSDQLNSSNSGSSPLWDLIGPSPLWNWSEDGWILGTRGELLIWIPDDWRGTLWQPSNTAVFSCPYSRRLDFTDCPMGENWHKGFPKSL